MATRSQKRSATTEVRLIGRLAADPKPKGRRVFLRLVVIYGIERHERTVLATGNGARAARQLKAGALVYVVGRHASTGDEHEIEAPHVLALCPARAPASG